MRVATRRLRSALKTFRPLVDREAADRVRAELSHLAEVLGHARDAEVLHERLMAAVGALPPELVLGPVARRVDRELTARYRAAHKAVVAELDGPRYRALLDDLDRLLVEPPFTELAARPARPELRRLVRRVWMRLDAAVTAADEAPTPEQREHLLHEVRKISKQVRYAGEGTAPVLGKDARRLAASAEAVQEVLGEHQDSVVTREALRELGVTAQGAGENGFTFGLLHGLEAGRADAADSRFAATWAEASRPKVLKWLR
jgi:CHAD domain-containing protein